MHQCGKRPSNQKEGYELGSGVRRVCTVNTAAVLESAGEGGSNLYHKSYCCSDRTSDNAGGGLNINIYHRSYCCIFPSVTIHLGFWDGGIPFSFTRLSSAFYVGGKARTRYALQRPPGALEVSI